PAIRARWLPSSARNQRRQGVDMDHAVDLQSRAAGSPPTRLAALPPWPARLLLLLVLALSLLTLGGPAGPPPPAASAGPGAGAHYTDRELYREVVRRVGQGQDYWAAAAAAQRGHGYPTAPPWAFREPALAWTLALLRTEALRWAALLALAAAAVVLTRDAAEQAPGPRWRRIAMALLFGVGLTTCVVAPAAPYLHEDWAAVLIGLSLAL